LGRPRGRTVISRPSSAMVRFVQRGPPYQSTERLLATANETRLKTVEIHAALAGRDRQQYAQAVDGLRPHSSNQFRPIRDGDFGKRHRVATTPRYPFRSGPTPFPPSPFGVRHSPSTWRPINRRPVPPRRWTHMFLPRAHVVRTKNRVPSRTKRPLSPVQNTPLRLYSPPAHASHGPPPPRISHRKNFQKTFARRIVHPPINLRTTAPPKPRARRKKQLAAHRPAAYYPFDERQFTRNFERRWGGINLPRK